MLRVHSQSKNGANCMESEQQSLTRDMLDNTSDQSNVSRETIIQVPGKMYIAGEYAVVAGKPAILVPITRFLTVTAVPASQQVPEELALQASLIFSAQFPENIVAVGGTLDSADPMILAQTSARVAFEYVRECGVKPTACDIRIDSHLNDANGQKYGFGSSGAVVVGVIKAVLDFCGVLEKSGKANEACDADCNADCNADNTIVFKLACYVQQLLGDNGSYGDLACCAFAQPIFYIRPSINMRKDENETLLNYISRDWSGLTIEVMKWPHEIITAVGWTSTPASSAHLVSAMHRVKTDKAQEFRRFLADSERLVLSMKNALKRSDSQAFLHDYAEVSALITRLSNLADGMVETPALTRLREIAESCGFVAKSSGAGGGDCAIAMACADSISPHSLESLRKAWKNVGIIPVDCEFLTEFLTGENND